jgi:HK97 family phage major capsid protein
MASLFQMKADMASLEADINQLNEQMVTKAADPTMSVEDLTKIGDQLKNLDARHGILKAAIEKQENLEREELEQKMKAKTPDVMTADPAMAKRNARGEFYRAALVSGSATAKSYAQKAYAHLGAIPTGNADLGTGDNLLPTTMSSEIVAEPFQENPMRSIISITNITGLELPKIPYTIDNAFIDDTKTATELQLTGNKVTFGRNKLMIEAQVSDTVLRGTPIALQGFIDNALRSGLALKEKQVMFASAPASAEAHMSFYNTGGIAEVEGDTMLDAILAAYGDLADGFAANAKVVMRRAYWAKMVRDLSNSAAPIWGAKPEDIIGIPVIFVDTATVPVVGDFSYMHLNYDLGSSYDTDKDVSAGIYKFVLTAWFDVQIKLASAFRLATLTA